MGLQGNQFKLNFDDSKLILALYSAASYFWRSCFLKAKTDGKVLSYLHLYMNSFTDNMIESRTVSVFVLLSTPNSIKFSLKCTLTAIVHFSFIKFSKACQERLVHAHRQKRCSIMSFSILQKSRLLPEEEQIKFERLYTWCCVAVLVNILQKSRVVCCNSHLFQNRVCRKYSVDKAHL